jgi:dTDP-4-dehydrorhamnose 3,5-epimerase-like enzyme
MNTPYLIEFPQIGQPSQGYLSIGQSDNLPFVIKRLFWTYFTPHDVVRGRHAHHHTQMIIIAVHGRIELRTETLDGEEQLFRLDSPNLGVFIPKYTWHTMQYSHDAVQLVLTDTDYDEADYIRDYATFQGLSQKASNKL